MRPHVHARSPSDLGASSVAHARTPKKGDTIITMSHAEPRSTPLREGQIAIATGALYGVVHTLSGHPLDNVKAALQMDKSMHGLSGLQAARAMWRRDGARAFWRGCIPPLWGSAVYRSIMMSSYEATYTFLEATAPADSWLKRELLGCIRPLVVCSTVVCSLCRVVVEAPIEQAKVSYQLGRQVDLRLLYRGALTQTVRTTAMMLCVYVPFDYAVRHAPWIFSSLAGNFALVSTVCGFAYASVWPVETLKNLAQAGLPRPNATTAEQIAYLGGARGLYRGAAPGVLCGAFRNGCAGVAMNGLANPLLTRLGLRDVNKNT